MSVSHEADVKPRRSQLVAEFLKAAESAFVSQYRLAPACHCRTRGHRELCGQRRRNLRLVPSQLCRVPRCQGQGHAEHWCLGPCGSLGCLRDAERGPSLRWQEERARGGSRALYCASSVPRSGQVLWRRTRRSSVGTRDRNPDPDSALDRVLGATTVCPRDKQWNEEGFC